MEPLLGLDDLSDLAERACALTAARLATLLRADLACKWRRDRRVTVEEYIERFPRVASDRAAVVDLIYQEVVQRERLGESPRRDE